MKNNQFKQVISILHDMRLIKTWTKEKTRMLNKAISVMQSGDHEYFTSNYRIHGNYVGLYYLNDKSHKRRGYLKKYRGCNIMVMCVKRGKMQMRTYIVSVVKGQIDIPKTNKEKIDQGWQPNILPWWVDLKTGKLVE